MNFVTRYNGMSGPAKAWLLAKVLEQHSQVLVISADQFSAERLIEDTKFFLSRLEVLDYPAWDTLPFEMVSPQVEVSAARIQALHSMHTTNSFLCVTTAEALCQRSLSPEEIDFLSLRLRPETKTSKEELIEQLQYAGYQRVSLVEHVGQFAARGYNIDLFANGFTLPVRIELSHQQVKSIRYFDPDTQRSTGELSDLQVLPVREFIPLRSDFCREQNDTIFERLETRADVLETPLREKDKVLEALKNNSSFPGIELYHSIAFPDSKSLFDNLPHSLHVVCDDMVRIEHATDEFWELVTERYDRLSAKHYFIPTIEQHYVTESWRERLANVTYFDQLEVFNKEEELSTRFPSFSLKELNVALQTKVGSGQALAPLARAIEEWRSKHYSVAIVVGAEVRAERIQQMLQDLNIDSPIFSQGFQEWHSKKERNPVAIVMGHISAGVMMPELKLVLVAEHEVFKKRSYRKHNKQSVYTLKQLLQSLGELHEEDLVVHDDYGIGRYHGLKNLTIEGLTGDFLHVEYADSTLYVPVQQIAKIQKYNGPDGSVPSLDKLSSNRWKKTKKKVRDSVVSLAGDLVKLYAARSVADGWPFEPMGAADEDFADAFPYNETVDQLNAIHETLTDMAKPVPMDRLICGDVGFGKTEVAMRAAFKCIQHGRQVAVLVPTTILVEQHRDNFEERFAETNVAVAAVSRFYSPKKNKQTLEGLADGSIDIVIGTHALLANSVSFADLGLVIIDEEHRFGVAQKEKLKRLKLNVDVLTLTATPIPRTLHMSLLGLRDASLITTPPTDRKVVRTYVATRDDILVRDTILRELKRNGQVFFVHNRVKTIATVTDVLQELVPEARFAFAHGQMSEKQLEPIMKSFVDKELDVLVATSIIESGLDIPNANTLIVDRSDTFGLAQLYQLRGRVGRGTRQAYAYFLIPNMKKLTGEAQQRLQALQSLDDLGQGFHLAVRDLEIRGAGNLLGKEQSGTVLAVGFELYMKIVKEAVQHLKGEPTEISDKVDPEVKLSVQAFIPEFYIPDVSERLIMYQRLAAIIESEEADALLEEMTDRCGPPPKETLTLIEVMRIRGLLRQYGIIRLEERNQKLLLNIDKDAPLALEKLLALTQEKPKKYSLGKNLLFRIALPQESNDIETIYLLLKDTLQSLVAD